MKEFAVFYPEGHAAHVQPGHPERPERVEAVRQGLQAAGLWPSETLPAPLTPAIAAAIARIHSRDYLSLLERAAARGGGRLDADTYLTAASWQLAQQAAAGACHLAEAVWSRAYRRGFALTRPPGHHALGGQGMGFCLLNNVAIAAQYVLDNHAARRLAIVDLDLHHGNGTEAIFWQRSDVLFISTHQAPLYPGTGAPDDVGAGEGAGYTVNLPLPPGSGDRAFAAMMQQVILPALKRCRPEMLLVSFGFDPHWRDPLGSLQLSAAGYAGLITALSDFSDGHCQGRIALFLEGGYDLDAAAACAQAAMQALLGLPVTDTLGPAPRPESERWQLFLQAALAVWGEEGEGGNGRERLT